MVRTKADRVSTKAVGGKAPGKVSAGKVSAGKVSAGTKSSDKKSKSYGGKNYGNPYHPRETPEWQKPITSFMNMSSGTLTNTNDDASSTKEKIENQTSNSNCEDPNADENTTEEED